MAFVFTSVGAKLDSRILGTTGPYVFKIYGALSHHMESLLPLDNDTPAYAQLYIMDLQQATTT
jgi:hypothetical protein